RAGEATPGALWTAGLVVRRSAWQDVRAAGFEPMLLGRRGNLLSAGEDSELCFALTQAGWRLAYEPRLRYRHAIPPARLTWAYVQRGRLRALMAECGEYRDRTRRAREVVRRLAGRRR